MKMRTLHAALPIIWPLALLGIAAFGAVILTQKKKT
jgi:hypothetical protein